VPAGAATSPAPRGLTAACGEWPARPHASMPYSINCRSPRTISHLRSTEAGGHPAAPSQRHERGAYAAPAGPSSSSACPPLTRTQRPGCWRTRDGCVVQLLVNVDENGVVFDLAGVNRDGAAGEHADSLAGGQVVA